MASILAKIRNLGLSNFHALLDAAIDLNSVESIKQHCRDLEEAKNSILDQAAVARARVATIKGELASLQLVIDTNTEHAELLLGDDDPSNDGDAVKLMERVVAAQESQAEKQTELTEAKRLADGLADAARKLAAKHAEMVGQVRKLESLERSTKAKETAAEAIHAASSAVGAVGDVSVDNVAQRIHERGAVADARFEQAMGTVSDSADESVTTAKAKALIAKMRAKKQPVPADGPAETGAPST